jgi:hypothetical protein
MTALDLAELLAEMRAMRAEIGEIKLAMAEARGKNLESRVEDLGKRVGALELWRAGLIATSSLAVSGAGFALVKLLSLGK